MQRCWRKVLLRALPGRACGSPGGRATALRCPALPCCSGKLAPMGAWQVRSGAGGGCGGGDHSCKPSVAMHAAGSSCSERQEALRSSHTSDALTPTSCCVQEKLAAQFRQDFGESL